jgi:mono/diheme cytochrome c family protein
MKTVIATVLVLIVLGAAIGLVVMYSGMYNIAATSEHTSPGLWAIETTKDISIRKNAGQVEIDGLNDSALIAAGFGHFDHSCVVCHSGPGVGREEFAEGLYPEAPELSEEAEEWTDAELFWITKHGIKMTGMPAFGDTHRDSAIKAITAFVRKLPDMGYYDYLDMREAASGGNGEDHSHEASDEHEH